MPTDRSTQPIPTTVTVTVTATADQRRRWTACADYRGLTVEQWLAQLADREVADFERAPLDEHRN